MRQAVKLATMIGVAATIGTAPLRAETADLHLPIPIPQVPGGVPDPTRPGPDKLFLPQSVTSSGTVTVEGKPIAYDAVAGSLVVHPRGWDDTAWREKAAAGGSGKDAPGKDDGDGIGAEASMFYVAYFKKGVSAEQRPVTFLFNGGPGSATVWLHMGAVGPRRVITSDDSHTPAAPYQLVNNSFSLLDASDLVFIDAPGTGFSRIAGKDKDKAFWGMDADAHAFAEFIKLFLTQHGRWNSPKYLFGESYGTPRAAVVANELASDDSIDLNGVIMLSQILNFDLSIDDPDRNPGADEAYVVSLPTYAATAWYHNRLAGTRPAELEPFLHEVEHFATTDYAQALQQGNELDPAREQAIAAQMARYTGLSADYIVKSNLRVNGGQFEQQLQLAEGLTTGRLDSRFSGPAIDLLDKEADYDPQSAAISSAYVAVFNTYVRDSLHFTTDLRYFPINEEANAHWDLRHKQPGQGEAARGSANVLNDLAYAMKQNPGLKIMVNGGYFDLATPYYEGWYEMHHLPIPPSLQGNIEYKYYQSGHMVYAHQQSLQELHDAVAGFIARTDNVR
jgi:carboxypeptidase C (cathepsin A)